MLHFARHYINILQEVLTSLMLLCCKFVKVYVCKKLLKYCMIDKIIPKIKWCSFLTHSVECWQLKAKFHYAIQLAKQLTSWSATC